jgi:uncharacterized SAM-binding protein YcdF (DUF218 family)
LAGRRALFFKFTAGLVGIAGLLALTGSWWLPALGWGLVHDDGPSRADIAVVLAGDYYGHRILKAAELVQQGYVPAALISGPRGFYGQHECELAIAFAVRKGYPEKWFIPFPDDALSTHDEAAVILPALRQRNVHRLLLITSNYHTARALRIFRAANRAQGGSIEIHAVAAPDEYFRPGSWWRSRQGQKIALEEWEKTIATAAGF